MPNHDRDTLAFLAQNYAFAATLDTVSPADQATLDDYAEHHAGGLFVLLRYMDSGPLPIVKCHDTWGDTGPNGEAIVVHWYDPDDEAQSVVRYYATAGEALAAFLRA